jgi:hypothetical protein
VDNHEQHMRNATRRWGKLIRYYAYAGWSREPRYQQGRILLIDFRDVFFQVLFCLPCHSLIDSI